MIVCYLKLCMGMLGNIFLVELLTRGYLSKFLIKQLKTGSMVLST